jgi:serine protease Do
MGLARQMARRFVKQCASRRRAVALFVPSFIALMFIFGNAIAESRSPGYAEGERVFSQYSIDQRIRIQILLTASGYWQAVPNENFNSRLFQAIKKFQTDHNLQSDGILNETDVNAIIRAGGPLLNNWAFANVKHPTVDSYIWVPSGLGLTQVASTDGLQFTDPRRRLSLEYQFFVNASVHPAFDSVSDNLTSKGFRITYSKIYRDDFFVLESQ